MKTHMEITRAATYPEWRESGYTPESHKTKMNLTPCMTDHRIDIVLRLHGLWRRGENGGSRADFSGGALIHKKLGGADLRGANFRGADLRDTSFQGTDLRGADFSGAYLRRSNFQAADLSGASLRNANLRDANINFANLRGADLRGAHLRGANLQGANFSGAHFTHDPDVPVVEGLDAKILQALASGGSLNESMWHTNATMHSRGGWAIVLAGEAGRLLEAARGRYDAARDIYLASTGAVPSLFGRTTESLCDIRKCAAEALADA